MPKPPSKPTKSKSKPRRAVAPKLELISDDGVITAQEQRFVEAYCVHANGTRAAKEAGYGGSVPSLTNMACKLLNRPAIIEAINEIRHNETSELELRRSHIRTLIANMLFFDPADLMMVMPDGSTRFKDIMSVPKWVRVACISKYDIVVHRRDDGSSDTTYHYEWVDKTKLVKIALELKGMLRDEDRGRQGSQLPPEMVSQLLEYKIPPHMIVGEEEIQRRLTIVPAVTTPAPEG